VGIFGPTGGAVAGDLVDLVEDQMLNEALARASDRWLGGGGGQGLARRWYSQRPLHRRKPPVDDVGVAAAADGRPSRSWRWRWWGGKRLWRGRGPGGA